MEIKFQHLLVPEGHILDPELPGVGVNVHVGGEPLVVGVALDTMCKEMYVSIPYPGNRSD